MVMKLISPPSHRTVRGRNTHTHSLPLDWNMCSVLIAASVLGKPCCGSSAQSKELCVYVRLCLKIQVHFRAHLCRLPAPAALIEWFFHAWPSDHAVDYSTHTHTQIEAICVMWACCTLQLDSCSNMRNMEVLILHGDKSQSKLCS